MSLFDLFQSAVASQTREAFTPEPPWKAKTVIAAGLTTLAGVAGWIADLAPLAVARFGVSYIGGFFLGWAFRRFVKLVFVIGAFAVAGLALMKNVGWLTTDWGQVERHITHHLTAIRQGAEGVKQFLASYLPATGAAAAGVFLGFRKK